MLRADIVVVAMAVKMSTDRTVVTRDDVAVEPRHLVLKETFDGWHQAANDLAAHCFAQHRMHDDEISAAFEPMVDQSRRFAVDIE